jgi:16S rRNA processing protein RimM
MENNNFVVIGKIEDAFGTLGKLKVKIFAPQRLWESLQKIYLKRKGGTYEPFEVESVEVRGRKAYLKLKGINTEEDALKMVGAHIYYPEEELPELKSGEYYYYQLVGSEVYTDKGEKLGTVQYIHESGGYPILVLENNLMIPFNRHFVKEVDTENKKIVVDSEKLPQ